MKCSTTAVPLLVLGAFAAAPGLASASDLFEFDKPAFYIGAGAGYNSIEDQDSDLTDDIDDSRVTYKVPFGVRMNRYWGVEGQYIDFGTAGGGNNQIDATGWTANLTGTVPLHRHFMPYAKIGALAWQADGRFPVDGGPTQEERDGDGVDLTWGVGLKVPFTEHLDVRAEWERFEFGDIDPGADGNHFDGVEADQVAASVVWTF